MTFILNLLMITFKLYIIGVLCLPLLSLASAIVVMTNKVISEMIKDEETKEEKIYKGE